MALEAFHKTTKAWFKQHLGEPTPAQQHAWPAIKQGRHTLISAPTGSGKTLAAFYAVIDDLITQGLDGNLSAQTHVVYISPLKALSNDIQRNLQVPLFGIQDELLIEHLPPVEINVAVRTGDTTPTERQKMLRKPPHILVTTPESLYLLLTSEKGRLMLRNTKTIIIDEIHAMLGDKRGSHLALSIERLAALCEHPLQRIGLSATQKPIETVAKFLVGNNNVHNEKADCVVVDTGHKRKLELKLEVPRSPLTAIMSNDVWGEIYQRLVEHINAHNTTLIFVNTRRLAERLALALTEHIGEQSVSSHHGSMSKEHRFNAEQKLKDGKLKVLVATASMELGIDIGSVDLVVQISSPKSIAAFLQRVGRSGHSVRGTPKGILIPLTRDDLIECAALIYSIKQGDLDQIIMPQMPLDILAQQIVAELAGREWQVDQLFELLHNAYPYRNLTKEQFFDVVRMLADGYTTRRGRSSSYLHLDAINQQLRARKNARLTALTCGGAIPDMFDYQVVLDPENSVVGSLNEDFALESLPGDIFSLGSHSWQMLRLDGLKIRVMDAQGQKPSIPFWFGEGPGRTKELSESVSDLRKLIEHKIEHQSVNQAALWLVNEFDLMPSAAEQLVEYLDAGRKALGVMPTRDTIVMERFFDEVGDMHVVIHTPYGSRVNKAWGLALRKRFCKAFNFELQAAANEDSIVISLGSVHSFPLAEVYHYLKSKTVREILIQAMLDAPLFEVRWRWNASRAFAIQRNRAGKRVPPQFQRMQSEDLVAQIFPDQIACFENIQGAREIPDHPLVNQTIHDCLTEAMDIEELEELVRKIEKNELTLVAKDLREPSPFAQEIINANPYAFLDDAPFEERRTNAIRNRRWLDPGEVTEYSELSPQAIERIQDEAWPMMDNADELHDALMLMSFMLTSEATDIQRAWLMTLQENKRTQNITLNGQSAWITTERAVEFDTVFQDKIAVDLKLVPDWLTQKAWTKEAALHEIVRGRLECLGPVTATQIADSLGLQDSEINMALMGLENEGFVFRGRFINSIDQEQWCERRLLQRIHRYTIDAHRKSIEPVSIQNYMRFLFNYQHLTTQPKLTGLESAHKILLQLEGISSAASAWEEHILSSRMHHYDARWLDQLCLSGRITWTRLAKNKVKSKSRAVKNTPLSFITRHNISLWNCLRDVEPETDNISTDADKVRQALQRYGALFFDEIITHTKLLKTQAESAIGELISCGQISNDSFEGMRTLLIPTHKRQKKRYGIEHAGRWSLLHLKNDAQDTTYSEDELEQLIEIYLARWGVLFRKVLDKEVNAPAWRDLVRVLRRMELQGHIRGGRFIAGIGGEQFAKAPTVTLLRNISKRELGQQLVSISAADPLNLVGTVVPGKKVSRNAGNRILWRDGVPIATLEANEICFLEKTAPEQEWAIKQKLIKH